MFMGIIKENERIVEVGASVVSKICGSIYRRIFLNFLNLFYCFTSLIMLVSASEVAPAFISLHD